MSLQALATKYATLKNTKILAFREEGKEISFVVEAGAKYTFTQSQLELAIENITQAGIPADAVILVPSAPAETAPKARKTKKEG